MLRRLRAHFAFRRAEYLKLELRTCAAENTERVLQRHDEAMARWLELDRRETFLCPRRRESARPSTRPWHLDYWRDDRTCSYCGSAHPDDFMAAAEDGAKIGPTDKNYKAYLEGGKFYFQHLDADQRERLTELLDVGELNVDYPGYFYRRPFFIPRRDAA